MKELLKYLFVFVLFSITIILVSIHSLDKPKKVKKEIFDTVIIKPSLKLDSVLNKDINDSSIEERN